MLMTVADVANYLKLSEKTVLRLVKHGEIPSTKIANQWRFSAPVLEQWITGQMVLPDAVDDPAASEDGLEKLLDAGSFVDLEGVSLWAVLGELAREAASRGLVEAPDLFLEVQARRGGLSSTLLGSGILLLHLTGGDGAYIRASGIIGGYTERGLSIPSLTERRARLIFLILSPDPVKERQAFLKLMESLSDGERAGDLLTRCKREELYKRIYY